MPKRFVTVFTCSFCDAQQIDEPMNEWNLDGPPGSYQLDICKSCEDGALWVGIKDRAIVGKAAKPKKTKAKPVDDGLVACPDCAEKFTEGGLSLHRSKIHGQIAPTVAAKEQTRARAEKLGLSCPECGFKAASPQGLGSHRKTQHGIAGTGHH